MIEFTPSDYVYFVIAAYGVTFLTLTSVTLLLLLTFFRRRRELLRLERQVEADR